MSEKFIIDYSNIYDYIEDRIPYIFVDKAEIIDKKFAKGYKNFTNNEWFFPVHLPNKPIVPAAFQLECMTQLAGLIIQSQKEELNSTHIVVKKYNEIEIYTPVVPGDRLYIEAEIVKFRRGIIQSKACTYTFNKYNEKNVHSIAEFQMVMPDILNSFSPKKDK